MGTPFIVSGMLDSSPFVLPEVSMRRIGLEPEMP